MRVASVLAALLIMMLAIAGIWYWIGAGGHSMDFALRQKVSAQSVLHFSFPASMDKQSVEELMQARQDLQGDWKWEGETLVFDPVEQLKAGETYTFLVPSDVQTSDGNKLGRDLEFVFIVAGPPEVVARIPGEDAVGIDKNSRITLVFDRAMIPLSQVQGEFAKDDPALNPWPVTIDPPVQGRWRWMSTVAREFIPSKPLTEGTAYTVKVPAGITSVAGDATAKEFTWTFETLRPEITSADPAASSARSGPSTVITLHFNREMDLANAQANISLYKDPVMTGGRSGAVSAAPQGTALTLKPLAYAVIKDELTGKSVTDKTTLIISPQKPFAFSSQYGLYAGPGIRGTEGMLGTSSGFYLPFSTVGVMNVSKGQYYAEGNYMQISFSNPVDPKTLKAGITISPAPLNAKEFEWNSYEWSENPEVTGSPELKPSTAYTVTVNGVKDMYGQALEKPYTFSFTTPPVTPRAFIHSEGVFGIFEYGKPPVYHLNGVNVSQFDLEFAKLSVPQFLQIRSASQGYYNATTPPALTDKELYKQWVIKPPQKKDEWSSTAFDVSKQLGEEMKPGIYALYLRSPEYKQTWTPFQQITEVQYFALTNMAITLKYSGDKALVWVTDMRTGDPVKGAIVQLHRLDGKVARNGSTDAQGFYEVTVPASDLAVDPQSWQPEFWVTAEKDGDMAFVGSDWYDGVQPYNFGLNSDFHSPQAPAYKVDSYVYTERPIYKAGDTVSFKGIVRLRDWNGQFSMPANQRVNVRVNDAEGNEVFIKEIPVTEHGSFYGSFPVSTGATLGGYYLNATLVPDTNVGNHYMGTSFSVLAYRKPEYRVEIETPTEDYFNGQAIKATVKGEYYFGAPMGSSDVTWRVLTTDYYFNKFTDGWYSFALEDSWCWYECSRETSPVSEGKGRLNAAGQLDITVPVAIDDKALSQVYTIEADITDANNQVVSSRTSVYAHKADAYVGIRSQDYVVQPGGQAGIDLVTLKPDGTVLNNQHVTLSLFSRTWNTIRKKSVDGEYYYDNQPVDTFIRSATATTAENGKSTAQMLIPSGGEYRIVATVKDASGREAKAATSVYAWSSTYVNWPRSNTDRMDIVLDKPEYTVGDTAVLLVKSPYQGKGVKALVTIERENIISKKVIDITSNAQSLEIPITADLIPNAFVSVVVVKSRMGETFNENGLDTGAPAFKIGYAQLKVDTSSKELTVEIETDKERYGPGETVNVTLRTTDSTGKGMPAELSLGTVDMSLLALSSFETPDLTRLFYSQRGLGVFTSNMLSLLLERFKPGSKGGGGADPESRKRGTFRDTAYWNPSIVTDAAGNASVSFKLPDNLTTWQLLAVGSSKDHRFGSIAETIIETKKVIVRPVRPRFAVIGDEVQMGAIVHNFLTEKKTFTVTLTGSGFTAQGKMSQQITLEPDAQAKLIFPIKTNPGTSMLLRFKAVTEGAVDEIEETIPVHAFATPQSVATTGIAETVSLEKVIAPTQKDALGGSLSISVSPSLAAYLPKALDYLVAYPYGCTEQVMSGFLPMVALSKLEGMGAVDVQKSRDLEKMVTTGLQRIYNFQLSDGGFGYFEESERSYPSLSAYILHGLTITKNAGYSVDQNVIDRVIAYLENELRIQDLKNPLSLTDRAYILFALSEAGKTNVSLLNNLYEQRDQLPLFAQAQLAMSFENAGSGKADTILKAILNRTLVDSRGTHFEEDDDDYWSIVMNTTQRTTAIVLQAMVRIDPENALIPNVTRYLLTARRDGHWDTTQSTVHSLLAFHDYLQLTGELDADFQGGIEVNGKRMLTWDVDEAQALLRKEITMSLEDLKRGEENDVKIGLEGKGRLYYDLLLSYLFTGDRIEPAEEGIGIQRSIRPLEGVMPAAGPKVGGTYVVKLTLTVPQQRNYVAVESPVPAGMEIVDVSLETSQKNLLSGVDSATTSWGWDYWEKGLWYFRHREIRDDRLFLFAETLPPGVYDYNYIVRATTPGTFRQRPTRAFEMYFPEVFGQTEGTLVKITE